RMSKTKMNGVDPLEVFDKYGVDATRLKLASVGSTDNRWSEKQVETYRNFANKIWNAARFCLLNSDGASVDPKSLRVGSTSALHDRWIVSRLNKTAGELRKALAAYEFHEAVQTLYHFFWDDFCDWYIELSKSEISAEAATENRDAARTRLLTVLEQALRLLHPFMPYITEELWEKLPGNHAELLHAAYAGASPSIMLAAYPESDAALIDEDAEWQMQSVIDVISRVRNIRSEMNIKPGERVRLLITAPDAKLQNLFKENQAQISRLARASEISIAKTLEVPRASARAVLMGGAEVAIPLEGLIDFDQERERLHKEKAKLSAEAGKLQAQLANPQFAERAPAEKVEEVRGRIADIAQRNTQLDQSIANLG
ncbi:MAG TPA: class I tRNA ligase family protein, partial [Pyrinomonadaceae bacterium]|nr:class I tRNA ligase family protein [Pyrinomonadaceae bacterium]